MFKTVVDRNAANIKNIITGGNKHEEIFRRNEKNLELKAKIEELDKNPASTPKDYIKAAAEYGVELKEEDFQPAGAQGELADDELDAVAGGGDCFCVIGGGGSSSSKYEKTCACAVGGIGEAVYK